MYPPASAKAPVLALKAVQSFGKEDDDHKEEEEHAGGHAHDHAHDLKLGHHLVTASALVPDVILHVAPG